MKRIPDRWCSIGLQNEREPEGRHANVVINVDKIQSDSWIFPFWFLSSST